MSSVVSRRVAEAPPHGIASIASDEIASPYRVDRRAVRWRGEPSYRQPKLQCSQGLSFRIDEDAPIRAPLIMGNVILCAIARINIGTDATTHSLSTLHLRELSAVEAVLPRR